MPRSLKIGRKTRIRDSAEANQEEGDAENNLITEFHSNELEYQKGNLRKLKDDTE